MVSSPEQYMFTRGGRGERGLCRSWCQTADGQMAGCIDTPGNERGLIRQYSSTSTRFAYLCAAPHSKCQQVSVTLCKISLINCRLRNMIYEIQDDACGYGKGVYLGGLGLELEETTFRIASDPGAGQPSGGLTPPATSSIMRTRGAGTSWCNGWCTTRRFQEAPGPCRFDRDCDGQDCIEHYSICPSLWASAP